MVSTLRRTHRFNPDSSGLSCDECTFPKGNAVHDVAQLAAPGEGPHDGVTYAAPIDERRLNAQGRLVWKVMADGEWHTLAEVAAASGGTPEASVSARLRDFRKPEFGGHDVEHRRLSTGTWEYRLQVRQHATT